MSHRVTTLNPSLLQVTYLEATDSPSLCCWGMMGGGWGKAWLICPYAAGKAAETHTHTYMPMCQITHTLHTSYSSTRRHSACTFINSETGKSQTASFWVTDLHIVGLQRRPAVGGLLQWDSELRKERDESVTDTVGVTECVWVCSGRAVRREWAYLTSLPLTVHPQTIKLWHSHGALPSFPAPRELERQPESVRRTI